MRLDTHVHTSPGSRCSVMTVRQYIEALGYLDAKVACVTNHGDMVDFDDLVLNSPHGLVIVPGVEISSAEGDFLVFSADLDYLRSLGPVQELPEAGQRPELTAVVWAHPFAGASGGLTMREEYIARVAPRVDGIEVYNGNWPDEKASRKARRVAEQYGLAELGGSDAHRRESLYRCWTEVGEIGGAKDLVRAILARGTRARRNPVNP